MQTIPVNHDTATQIPGAVIDPGTGRLCATQIDIFRALGLSGNQVKATSACVYQDKYYDILDVLAGRKLCRRRGRPAKPGLILSEIVNLNPESAR
jgi:hypothetical protein